MRHLFLLTILLVNNEYFSQCNTITNNYLPDTIQIAQGDSAYLNVINNTDNFTGQNFGIQHIPDGGGGMNPFRDTITISGFASGDTIVDSSDLCKICLNMEHSYIGDLTMNIKCPNGDSIILMDQYNNGTGPGSTFLGDALDNSANTGNYGIGKEYCFTESAAWGTMIAEDALGNFIYSTVSPGNNILSPGEYKPEQSYSNLVGCPLNGDWVLTIEDNMTIDDGYLFDWGIKIRNCNTQNSITTTWLSNGNVIDSVPAIITYPDSSAWYFVNVQDSIYGCSVTDSVYINVIQPPQGGIYGDTVVYMNSTHNYYTPYNQTNTYKWSVSGGTIVGANDSSFVVINWGGIDSTASVALIINDSLPFTQNDTLHINVVDGTGIHQFSNSDVSIFPNPAHTNLNIVLNSNLDNLSIEMFDAIGKRVKNISFKNRQTGNYTFDISNLPKGVYTLRGSNQIEVFFQQKIIVE